MKFLFEKTHGIIFGVGAVAGAAVLKAIASPQARQLVVSGIAKGILAKDAIMEEVTNIREDAEDIYNEAKNEAKMTCDAEVVEVVAE